MRRPRRWAFTLLIITGLLAGCADARLRRMAYWPWAGDDDAYMPADFPTAARRLARLRELEGAAAGMSPEEQAQSVADLARQIQTEPDALIRRQIIRTVAQFDTPLAADVLRAGLHDAEPDVRIECCEAWGNRGGEPAVTLLGEMVASDAEVDVRLAAIRALGKIRQPATIAALAPGLEDTDPAVQFRTVQSMRNVYGQDLGNDVNAWRQMAQNHDGGPLPEQSLAERLRSWF